MVSANGNTFVMRRWRKGDCEGWLQFAKTYTCGEPVAYEGFCEHHLPYDKRRKRDYEATPIEKRQEYLDALKGGMTLGEAYRAVGISFEVACEITNRAIVAHTHHTFDFEAKA